MTRRAAALSVLFAVAAGMALVTTGCTPCPCLGGGARDRAPPPAVYR